MEGLLKSLLMVGNAKGTELCFELNITDVVHKSCVLVLVFHLNYDRFGLDSDFCHSLI